MSDTFARPEVRHEGALKVTGQARYTGDHYPDGILHVACLASPVPPLPSPVAGTAVRVVPVNAVVVPAEMLGRQRELLLARPALAHRAIVSPGH